MNHGRHFPKGFLFCCMCILLSAAPVRGQDTGAFFPSGRTHPAGDTARGANVPKKRDTPVPAAPARQIRSRDSIQPRRPQVPLSARPRTRTDTASRSARPAAPDATPTPPPPPPPANAPPRAVILPGFAGQHFDTYRSFSAYLTTHNALFHSTGAPRPDIAEIREGAGEASTNTVLFYAIAGVVLFLGIVRVAFTKYFSDLFRAFFNPTLSQRQLRDQLSQTPFPALLLNIYFTLSAGLYVFLILRHFHYITVRQPLVLIPVFMGLIMIVYLAKYAFLRCTGWLFNYPEVTTGYVFTLYMVNKVLGVALLPFILVLAFSAPEIASVALSVSVILIVLLFIYRYIRAYALVKNQIFFSKFQFFVYLCGFEIAPVLIIGKLVLLWLNGA